MNRVKQRHALLGSNLLRDSPVSDAPMVCRVGAENSRRRQLLPSAPTDSCRSLDIGVMPRKSRGLGQSPSGESRFVHPQILLKSQKYQGDADMPQTLAEMTRETA